MQSLNTEAHFVSLRKALLHSIEAQQSEMARCFLDSGADPNSTRESTGDTALTLAAEKGMLDVVKSLVKARADPSRRNLKRESVLTLAAIKNNEAMVKYLIENAGCGFITEGWMHKAGKEAYRKYQKRWFKIDPETCTLHYFKVHPNGNSEPKGTVMFDGRAIQQNKDKPHNFTIALPKRTYYFKTDSKLLCELWVTSLLHHCRTIPQEGSDFNLDVSSSLASLNSRFRIPEAEKSSAWKVLEEHLRLWDPRSGGVYFEAKTPKIFPRESAKAGDFKMDDVLSSRFAPPLDLLTFAKHCREECNEEHLIFLLLIRRFRTALPSGPYYSLAARRITRDFLEENARLEVNISCRARNTLLQRIKSISEKDGKGQNYDEDYQIFAAAEKEVFRLLRCDVFRRFKTAYVNSIKNSEEGAGITRIMPLRIPKRTKSLNIPQPSAPLSPSSLNSFTLGLKQPKSKLALPTQSGPNPNNDPTGPSAFTISVDDQHANRETTDKTAGATAAAADPNTTQRRPSSHLNPEGLGSELGLGSVHTEAVEASGSGSLPTTLLSAHMSKTRKLGFEPQVDERKLPWAAHPRSEKKLPQLDLRAPPPTREPSAADMGRMLYTSGTLELSGKSLPNPPNTPCTRDSGSASRLDMSIKRLNRPRGHGDKKDSIPRLGEIESSSLNKTMVHLLRSRRRGSRDLFANAENAGDSQNVGVADKARKARVLSRQNASVSSYDSRQSSESEFTVTITADDGTTSASTLMTSGTTSSSTLKALATPRLCRQGALASIKNPAAEKEQPQLKTKGNGAGARHKRLGGLKLTFRPRKNKTPVTPQKKKSTKHMLTHRGLMLPAQDEHLVLNSMTIGGSITAFNPNDTEVPPA